MSYFLTHNVQRITRYAMILFAMISLGGCSIIFKVKPEYELLFPWPDGTPLQTPTDSGIVVVHEEPGSFAVLHGFACAQSNRKGEEDFVRIHEELDLATELPSGGRYITDATVFLNGWRMEYFKENHHVQGFGAAITNIDLDRFELSWEAGGALAEHGFDSGYSWCYDYTVLAWNVNQLDMHVDHSDQENTFWNIERYDKNTTAVHVLPNYRQNVPFISSEATVTVLPRAFGLAWGYDDDQHVLQAAYNLGQSETFVQSGRAYGDLDPPVLPPGVGRVDSGSVSWDSRLILKDNKTRHDFYAAEIVSVFGGASVGVIQPPFTITPAEEIDSMLFTGTITGAGGEGGLKTENVAIENIPFDYAVPVLTGWSLEYTDEDHHVRDIGARIESFSYDKNPGDSTGTLRYTISSILDDRNEGKWTQNLHRVNILGWNSSSAGGVGGQPELKEPGGVVQ
ncbi:MAG: hypothetical protein AMJ65_13610 [Phycisphaerae bacterium SG8_4]|nr:MAG: hypothetical protein AMJ65_13610 [Phycisphaerae bacterium SG8_4]